MADQVMSGESFLTLQLQAAAKPEEATTPPVDSEDRYGVDPSAKVVKGCVRYAGVTQEDYDHVPAAAPKPGLFN